jgi:hypothetical protein
MFDELLKYAKHRDRNVQEQIYIIVPLQDLKYKDCSGNDSCIAVMLDNA